jgi:hypothetical protein
MVPPQECIAVLLTYNPAMGPLQPPLARAGPIDPVRGSAGWRDGRALAALAIALAADAVQIGLLPFFLEGAAAPWNDALDIGVGLALMALVGWHVAFLPAFVSELVPFLNLLPTWTASVIFVVTKRRQARQRVTAAATRARQARVAETSDPVDR